MKTITLYDFIKKSSGQRLLEWRTSDTMQGVMLNIKASRSTRYLVCMTFTGKISTRITIEKIAETKRLMIINDLTNENPEKIEQLGANARFYSNEFKTESIVNKLVRFMSED